MSDPNKSNTTINATRNTQRCITAMDWFLPEPLRRDENNSQKQATIKTLINGDVAFAELYERISKAEHTIDIAIWGFQPSMFFKRCPSEQLEKDEFGNPQYPFCIGDLLIERALNNVDVKVLVWATGPGQWQTIKLFGEANVGNMPGLSIFQKKGEEGVSELQKEYDFYWYKAVRGDVDIPSPKEWFDTHKLQGGGDDEKANEYQVFKAAFERLSAYANSAQFGKLQYKNRKLAGTGDIPYLDTELPWTVKFTLSVSGSHHQKTVLIDYEQPDKAVGFVLEHNMVDNYWDSSKHEVVLDEKGNIVTARPYNGRNVATPLQDVSSLLTGPILDDIYGNFKQSWNRSDNFTLNSSFSSKLFAPPANRERNKQADEAANAPLKRGTPELYTREKEGLGTLVYAQILRTYDNPEVEDIKAMYLKNITNTTRYIYTENQYFRWPPLVDAFVEHWRKMKDSGAKEPIHWFAVTNSSNAGMGSSAQTTDAMLGRLGRRDVLPNARFSFRKFDPRRAQREELERQQKQVEERLQRLHKNGAQNLDEIKQMQEELEALKQAQEAMNDKEIEQGVTESYEKFAQAIGIKAHICTLAAEGAWKEVYIHSKLTVIDDVFTFIGSANLNTRSMQVDSELGVITECRQVARDLRQTLWAHHTENDSVANPADMTLLPNTKEAYDRWRKLMDKNKIESERQQKNREKNGSPLYPLCEFFRELSFFEKIVTWD